MTSQILLYLLLANAFIAVFYLFYRLFLYGDTFFNALRCYWLFAITASLTVPALPQTLWRLSSATVAANAALLDFGQQLQVVTVRAAEHNASLGVMNIAATAFAAVSLFLLLRLVCQCVSILRLRFRNSFDSETGIVWVATENCSPFSFFNYIFLDETQRNTHQTAEIITHEKAHTRQQHWIDVLVSQLLCAIFWYNPAVYLIRRSIRQNLEYIADSDVLNRGYQPKQYQYHLLQLSTEKTVAIVNNFNVKQIKNRIRMMNRKQSSQWAMAKYCLLLPLLAALLVITNCAQAKNSDPAGGQTALAVNDSIYYECEVMPEFEGGMGALFEYLATNIRYPEQAKADEVLTSAVQFVVEKDGKVSNVSLKKSSGNSLLDAEAMRAVESMPKWTPGKQGGSPVRVSFVLPVQFSPGN